MPAPSEVSGFDSAAPHPELDAAVEVVEVAEVEVEVVEVVEVAEVVDVAEVVLE